MLAGCCRKLLSVCKTVTVMARSETRIKTIAPAVIPLVCDYNTDQAIAVLAGFSPDLVVAWIHGRVPTFRRALAARVRSGGRFVQVLGSAHGDPSRPERLEEMQAVANDLPLRYRAIVLGFAVERGISRWLTDDEISDGVFAAVIDDRPLSIVGTVTPWSARP